MSHGISLTLPVLQRPNFFAGLLLSADDLRAEQTYHRERTRLHNRLLHGVGVVAGLDVRSSGPRILIGPGMALDPAGNEIVLAHESSLTPAAGTKGGSALFVLVRYTEALTDPIELGDRTEFTRIVHGASLTLAEVAPRTHDDAIAIARLLWRTTQWRVDARYRRRRVKR